MRTGQGLGVLVAMSLTAAAGATLAWPPGAGGQANTVGDARAALGQRRGALAPIHETVGLLLRAGR